MKYPLIFTILIFLAACSPPIDEVPPEHACCMAMTADCLACAQGISEEGYCEEHPDTIGCADELTNPCAATTCLVGSICEAVDGEGVCSPIEGFEECTEVPDACTREYRPVCGMNGQTFGNSCGACAAGQIGYVPGECATPTAECDRVTPCAEGQMCYSVPDQPGRCYDEQIPSCLAVCGTHDCTILESNPPQILCPEIGGCAEGEDEYWSQMGPACITHMGEKELATLPVCQTNNDCTGSCAKVSRTTDGATVEFNEPYRCVPQDYENFLVHTVGLTTRDENGQEMTSIA